MAWNHPWNNNFVVELESSLCVKALDSFDFAGVNCSLEKRYELLLKISEDSHFGFAAQIKIYLMISQKFLLRTVKR